jgi:hypothetical protein
MREGEAVKLKRFMAAGARRLKHWLLDAEEVPYDTVVPFDNTSLWIGQSYRILMQDPVARRRPAYVWGVLKGCALGKVLGYESVSVIEFGVAGGAGLVSMERIAEAVESLIGIRIEVHGFDTGMGLPKTLDYRDCPNLFLDGQFPMDEAALRRELRHAKLHLGYVDQTVPEFMRDPVNPVAFVSFDLDLYASTRDALKLFEGAYDWVLPRVVCYFDDIVGYTYSDFNGERLAIREFNDRGPMRKLSPMYGLKYYVPPEERFAKWPELMYMAHFFEHPLYNEPDEYRKPMVISIEGQGGSGFVYTQPTSGSRQTEVRSSSERGQ